MLRYCTRGVTVLYPTEQTAVRLIFDQQTLLCLNNSYNENVPIQSINRSLVLINNTNTYFSMYQTRSLPL